MPQLQKSVAEAFAARQELHQAEVAALQERVADIQQTLKTRDKLSKEIIDKRVKDLLNPDINWDAAGGGAGGESGAVAGGGFGGAAAVGDGGVIAALGRPRTQAMTTGPTSSMVRVTAAMRTESGTRSVSK